MNPIYVAILLGILIWFIVFMFYNLDKSSFESSSNKTSITPNVVFNVPTFSYIP